jgi:hypothetical protein
MRPIHPPPRRASRTLLAVLLPLLCSLAPGGEALAQNPTDASIRGVVYDPDGSPVAGAPVTLVHGPSGAGATTTTDAGGRYQFGAVRPGGPYRVRVAMLGFAPIERTGVSVQLGQALVLDFRLSVRAATLEELTVRVEADPRFSTTRTGAAMVISEEAILAHPTVDRDFLQVADLSPNVTRTPSGGLSISGQNERYNSIVINGAVHQDLFGARASGLPGAGARAKALPLEAVQEFQVQVAPFDVRSSGFTGGFLNAVTRGGTNEWRGSAFGEYRDERFFGPLVVDGADLAPDTYRKQVAGATFGGPLRRDVMHIFVAAEAEWRTEPPPGLSLGMGDPLRTRLAPDSAARVSSILAERYGMDPGSLGGYSLRNPSANLFGRLDWRIGERHQLLVHQNYVRAEREAPVNRTPFGAYEFSSSGYLENSATLATLVQLNSQLREGLRNQLVVNLQRTRDRDRPVSTDPQVDVRVTSDLGTSLVRTLRAGSAYGSHLNSVGQDLLQATNALSWTRGDLTSTFGAGLDLFRFDHRYLPGSLGYYTFESIADLEANRPRRYEVATLTGGAGPSTRLTVAQPALFFQNEHAFPDGLVLHYGIRGDAPLFLGRPERNAEIEEAFGRRTDRLPSGHLLLSPRLGFNWQSTHRFTTQVRGGGGLFTGRVPYIWVANAYAHTGLSRATVVCDSIFAPRLDPSGGVPTTCGAGQPGSAERRSAVVFDEEFRYPRELKVSLAFDQRLPLGVVASAELLLVQTIRQVVIRDLNLNAVGASDRDYYKTFGVRRHYGAPIAPRGYQQRPLVAGYSHVLEMTNERTRGFAHGVTLGLERQGSLVTMGGSYSFNHSNDVQSLRSGDALTNMATSATSFDTNDPSRTSSAFESPWKTVLYTRARLPSRRLGTEISFVLIGQGGMAYSYVYQEDVNGDGYPGIGIPLDASNDMIFVPASAADLPMGLPSQVLFEQMIGLEPCLAGARGTVLRRNACRSPAFHRLDMKVVQPLRFGRRGVEATLSVINLLNLLDDSRGRMMTVAPLVPLLALDDREEVAIGNAATQRQRLVYAGPITRDAETGRFHAALPYTVVVPESQWQGQLGLRLTF